MLSITGVMVLPAYIFSTLYLWKLTEDGEYHQLAAKGRFFALITGLLGTVYGLWLIYAAGLKYLFLAFIFLAVGIPVFIWARKQSKDGLPVFTKGETVVLILMLLVAIGAIYAFARGLISV